MPAETPAHDLVVRRFVLVALVLPCLVVLLGAVALLIALRSLPDPVAIHWGATGAPDGFGPSWAPIALLGVVGLGVPLLLTLPALPGLRRGGRGGSYRFLGALSLGVALLLAVLVTVLTLAQVGLADAVDAPPVGPSLTLAVAVAAAGLAAGWLLQPAAAGGAVPPAPAETLDLHPGERAVWLRTTTMARSGIIVLSVGVVVLIGANVLTWSATDDPAPRAITLLATVAVAVAVVTNAAFRVLVDADGLTVRSVLGWPRLRVPLADVEEAVAEHVDPVGDFGGWGLRWTAGRTGVVLRAGEGIRVRRRRGRDLTVTVDDAETGAALLNALAARAAR